MVSQEVLGSAVKVLARDGEWARIRGYDGYEGWISTGGFIDCDADTAEAWWDETGGVPALSLDALLEDENGGTLARLPWGARVARSGAKLTLPDGRSGRLGAGELVGWSELGERFPGDGAAVVRTATAWAGAPYLWGGRTRWGVDCSGFVQAVYRLHGFLLPRDSYQQLEYGEPIEVEAHFEELRPGDLVFFKATDSERIVHVAFSAGGSRIIHAALGNGVIQEDDLRETGLGIELAGRVAGVRRFFV
jgi:hypothetical protein